MAGYYLGGGSVGAGGYFVSPYGESGGFQLPPLTEAAKTAVTGTQTEDKFAVQIIGKDIPIFVGGQALMGCRICEGPFITTVSAAGLCDMIVVCAVSAVPTATRTITSLNLNGTQSWTLAGGFIGTAFAGMEINFLYGTEEQTPLASSIARFGDHAVPYRSHIGIELKNIPLDVFNNQIPFVSIFVHQDDSLSRTDALERLARYARYDDSEFEMDVTGVDDFWIVAQQSTFIEYMQQLRKVFRNWNITTTDKLRVFENDSSDTTITLTRDDFVDGSINLTRIDPLAIPAERAVTYIDTEMDNEFNTVTARRVRFPVPITAAANSETIELPIGTTAIKMMAAANRSMLIDDIARTQFSGTLSPIRYGITPGDIIAFSDDPDITFLGRVITAARKVADFTTEIVAEKIDFFTTNTRPVISSDGAGSTASVSIDEHTTAVTTVEATDSDGDGIFFSITAGADQALFSINSSTGVLEFLVAPLFASPTDADTNNVYEVTVTASDGSLTDTQAISVTVNDAVDSGIMFGFPFPITIP